MTVPHDSQYFSHSAHLSAGITTRMNTNPATNSPGIDHTGPERNEEQVLLELPHEQVGGEYQYADEITITTRRITTDGNTFTLEGVTGVRFEKFHPLEDPKEHWIGWGLIVIGLPLLLTGIFGILAIGAGIMFVYHSGRSKLWTGQIILECGNGKKLPCYKMKLGTTDASYWTAGRKDVSEDWINEKVQSYFLRSQRMQLIADKIGEALGRR